MNPPTTIANIEYTESTLGFKFPDDFKHLYLVVDGFKGLDWQEHMFTFWPLQMIIEEFDEEADGMLGFSDFLLNSHIMGFRKNERGIFKYCPSRRDVAPEYIKSSFKEVVEMINSNHDLIY